MDGPIGLSGQVVGRLRFSKYLHLFFISTPRVLSQSWAQSLFLPRHRDALLVFAVIRGVMVVKSIMEKVINEGAVAREASREFDLKSVVLRQESRAEQSHQDCRSIIVNSSYRLRLVGRNRLSNSTQHLAVTLMLDPRSLS